MREYELVYLIADSIAEDKQSAVLEKVKKFITEAKGEIIKEENLGRRRLAYQIKKNDFATYVVVNFKVEGSEISEIERDLRLMPEIIRQLVVLRSVEHVSILEEKLVAASEEEIKEAIGGKRSFEVVDGETEQSYDLMAKRDKEAESPETEKLKNQGTEKQDAEIEEPKAEIVAEPSKKPRAKKVADYKEDDKTLTDVIPAPHRSAGQAPDGIQSGSQIESGMTEKIKTDTKEKVAKKAVKKTEVATEEAVPTEKEDKIEPEAKVAAAKPKADSELKSKKTDKELKLESEVDRLKKLDDKLDEILGDDL